MTTVVIVTIYLRQIQHHIHLTEGEQNTKLAKCHIHCTVPIANFFYRTKSLLVQANNILSRLSAKSPRDGWSAQRAIGIQAETERSDVSACLTYF